ncbi:TPA: hypothetical protein ACGSOT_001329, partial [Escherichia coli]
CIDINFLCIKKSISAWLCCARGRVRIRGDLLIEQVICISKIKLLNMTPFAIGVMSTQSNVI